MSKIFYKYNPDNGLLVTSFVGTIDKLASKDGKIVYVTIPNVTDIAPGEDIPGRVQFFDKSSNSWRYTEDNRGKQVINKLTKEIKTWDAIGLIPNEYTTDIPKPNVLRYMSWQGTYWDIVGEDRDRLLDDIWRLRKQKRDEECASDLVYKGHPIHVDEISFVDITLAAQEAILVNDMITTRRWITADDTNVQLNGGDFIAIMRMYGDRRQRLVYESNEAWQQDLTRSTEELLSILKRLQTLENK